MNKKIIIALAGIGFVLLDVKCVDHEAAVKKIDIAKMDENTDKTTLLNAIQELQASNAAYVQLNKDIKDFVAEVVNGIRRSAHMLPLSSAQQLINTIADDLEQSFPTL
ncbi:MAG: hypothetical protein LBJ96_02475 [Holosporaceae bacterium]|jgi:hypothetical protein|nr:hypothetical protein [Holosporaceae bacterium]